MLTLPSNHILPVLSSPIQKSRIHKPRPTLNFESVFCSKTLNTASIALPNSGRTHILCYSIGNFINCFKSPHRRCADFRDCGRSVKVRCGISGAEDDAYYMRRAVERAREAIGCTSPNPMVGCVIVKDGEIVGEGLHPKAGQPHAEVFALRNAGELAEGATAYVSLEPCNHYGRTPPCSEALIKAKVSKVVVGMVDPNPIVASKGVEKLRAAGIQVVVGIEEDLCKRLNECYIHKMLTGKPFVTLRYSISTNGLFLNRLGEGASVCGGYYSKLLQEYDVVIQSSGTVIASMEPKATQPHHIVLGNTELAQNSIMFMEEEVCMDKISLEAVLDYCGKKGLCSVLVDVRGNFVGLEELIKEGVQKNLLQKIVVEVLPVWAGSSDECVNFLTSITQGFGLKNLTSIESGGGVLIEGYL